MWPTSGRWDAAVRGSGRVAARVELWRNGVFVQNLNVVSGSLTVDESAAVRRQARLVVGDVDLTPIDPGDTLTPFGPELHVFAGVTYTEGDQEVVPVGVLPVTQVVRSRWLGGLDIEADDYSYLLQRDRWDTWATPAGSTAVAEITRMAQDSIPGLTVIDLTGSQMRTTATEWDRDRWAAIRKLASSFGAEAFFDPAGRLIIRAVPQVTSSTSPVWTVDSGTPTAVMTDVAVGMSAANLYNAVVASSSASGVSVSAAAYQQSGPFAWGAGSPPLRRRRFYASPFLTSVEQCLTAAGSILAKSVAFSRNLDPTSAPNPALDAGDPLLLRPPDGTSETRILSRFTLDLKGGPMPMSSRVGLDVATTDDVGSLT